MLCSWVAADVHVASGVLLMPWTAAGSAPTVVLTWPRMVWASFR